MKKSAHVPGIWKTAENGYEKTNSQELIRQTLSRVIVKRQFVTFLAKDYQSDIIVFVSIGPKELTFDKPIEWPGLKRVRVVFKNEAKVWHLFNVSVVGEGKDTVITTFPTELFRLQRRAHFRVEVPRDSVVSFSTSNDESVENIMISNISIGGLMMCFAEDDLPKIKDQDVISNIEVTLQPPVEGASDKQEEEEVFYIEEGLCVRSFIDENMRKKCIGVKFTPRPNEEMKLMRGIRQLELDELRKGCASL